jgi:hypothetical protein
MMNCVQVQTSQQSKPAASNTICIDCGIHCHTNGRRCKKCSVVNNLYRVFGTGQYEALTIVANEIRRQRMRPAKEYKCVDCGGEAAIYEHRDYGKPLEVEPVCQACNLLRGHAIPKRKTFNEFVTFCLTLKRIQGKVTAADFSPFQVKFSNAAESGHANKIASNGRSDEKSFGPANKVLQQIKIEFGLKTNGDLAEFLGVTQATICRLRYLASPVRAKFINSVHRRTGWPVSHIKRLVGQA